MKVTLVSFGYRHGIPPADLGYNIRDLDTPSKELCNHYSGLDKRFQSEFYRLADTQVKLEFLVQDLQSFLSRCNTDVTIAIGCHNGRHRSVAIVEYLKRVLPDDGLEVEVEHRDVARKKEKGLWMRERDRKAGYHRMEADD